MDSMDDRLRLLVIYDGPHTGAENMAIDRALLSAYEEGELAVPLLRVYSWDPPAVSLGYHQREQELDLKALASAGVDLVRRPTGGSAVLHADEWTYAIAGPRGIEGLGDGFATIYATLASVLVAALGDLGVDARSGGRGGPDSFACFEALEGHEISVEGRKLVGSAFRQTRHAFLQHGSLLRGPAHLELVDYLAGASRPEKEMHRERLRRRTTHLAALGRPDLDGHTLAQALGRRLSEVFGAPMEWREEFPSSVLQRLKS